MGWPDGYDDLEDVALPLYEGRMIGQFDFSEKGWLSGHGRGAVWQQIEFDQKYVNPQFLMALSDVRGAESALTWKTGQMRVSSATNARTLICAFVSEVPCGDKVATLRPREQLHTVILPAVLNSLCFDFAVRARAGGLQVDQHILMPNPVLRPQQLFDVRSLLRWTAGLCAPYQRFADVWHKIRTVGKLGHITLQSMWALTRCERLRIRCLLDAVVAELYGVNGIDFRRILLDCDHPSSWIRSGESKRTLDPKGFWRVDKDSDPELRHTVLAQVAFQDLQCRGLDAFLEQNDGEGWMLPETLRLADYGLGHDDRAKEPQPVAPLLGPRFFPWQLEQSVEESWEECERHAELIAKIVPPASAPKAKVENTDAPKDLFGDPVPVDLFGNPQYPKSQKRRGG